MLPGIFVRIIAALSLVVSLSSTAGDVVALYNANVVMTAEMTQKQAARQALQRVLIKVSGSLNVAEHSDVRKQLSDATDYLLSYQFDLQDQQRIYRAQFDQQKVDKLLRDAGLAIWGKTRPSTLIWLAEQQDEEFNRTIISEQSQSQSKELVLQRGKERGLDLSFPLVDLDDLMRVSVYDVWGRFLQPVVDASQRYQADSMVIARIYQQKQIAEGMDESLAKVVWHLDWSFVLGNRVEQQSAEDLERDVVISQMVNSIADTLANRYAIEANTNPVSHYIELTVTNISGLAVYENVRIFLKQLTAVADVTLSHISGTNGRYRLRMVGSEQDLINALELDSRMQRVVDQFGQPVKQLEFVWAP
ncbi:DUF2066 domain-containing protein [Neptunicella marina]|uniref:DUF2066 domain-containing protein n=1 Tax=Neptunicella marina TaxID=2125989 RepID=A0A8J6M0H3_9ALTE|nr:DUF2066 domain-containing protein [Neptunicella marina]MBC3767345.1 DUF2066 domain-containing protein [Neptunicella marina]